MMLAKLSVDQALLKAKSHLKKDEIVEAKKLYQAVLVAFPKNIRAQQGLALLSNHKKINTIKSVPQTDIDQLISIYNQGQFSSAVDRTRTLLEQHSDSFVLWNILGNSSIQLGLLDNAIQAYSKCISIKPDYAEAYNNLGVALKDKNELQKAIDAFNKCISLKPSYAEVYYNKGNILHDQKKYLEAIANYDKCISLNPDYADVYFNKGVAFNDLGMLDKAIKVWKKCILLRPNNHVTYNNLGNALKNLGKRVEAIHYYNKALLIKPDYAVALSNMGVVLKDQGKYDEAIDALEKAILLNPNYAPAYNNLAVTLKRQNKINESITAYSKALSLKPDYENPRAEKLLQQANICDWDIPEEENKLIPSLGISDQVIPPFAMLSLEDAPERHRLRSEVFAKTKYTQNPLPSPAVPSHKPERIRIGYFSADFHEHATMYLISKVFKVHDRQKFEIYAYSYGPDKSPRVRQNLIKSVDVFDDVREMSDKDIAMIARQDKLDIAVDLKGHTRDQRLGIFAYRPAPIQISYLGYPGTTGANFIDYIVADPIVIPTDQVSAYSEKIIYLPNTYQPNDNTRSISTKMGTRKDMELPEKGFVFCCFNSNYKISSAEFDIWMRLLSKVKGSVLWLLKSNQWAEENLKKEAEKRGVQKDRLVFAERLPIDEHLARHIHADLFIDTFNVNAHTTASDALWAGLPVVTKLGQSFVARVAGSLLNAVGLPELITKNEKDYEELIFELATNPDKLKKIKDKLAANRLTHPLFDTESYTKDLENGYYKAYNNYFEGNKTKNIKVQ